MSNEFDSVNQFCECSKGWQHWLPFAALTVRGAIPANRPLATRIIEQVFVAAIAGGGSAYGTMQVVQARQEEQIKNLSVMQSLQINDLKEQMRDSEIRLTDQIVEIRSRQLK